MPSAEIVTIGTELLLGEIVDSNSAYLARKLRDLGVDVFRTSTVGDNVNRIAEMIRETLARAQIIITTGGLGPTVDDPTREAIALALGVELEFRPELWDQILERMNRFGRIPTENQKRQAYIPQGALAVKNPVGTAPAFIFEQGERCIISLPGVPREMEYLIEHTVLPYLRGRYQLTGTIKARVLHTAGVGESVIDEQIGDLEKLSNPTVGLAAHAGMVDVRITAKAESVEKADALIADMEKTLRERLGAAIYGADADTLEQVTLEKIAHAGWTFSALEVGLAGALIQKLSGVKSPAFKGGEVLPYLQTLGLKESLVAESGARNTNAALGVAIVAAEGKTDIEIYLLTPRGLKQEKRSYGGHVRLGAEYAANLALDMFRLSVDNLENDPR
jgi:competence/damage-inducible protein CinA-like protein